MPSFRRVSFSDKNHYSRLPHDDELYVMKAFARHADRCDSCYDPYQAYKDGSTLCPRGHERALDVAQYVYSKAGQAYSQVDRERNQRVQVEIPANCEAVRSLLKAMDRGLRVMRKHTPTSYDRTYYIPARLSVPDNHRFTPATRPTASTPTSNSRKRSNSTKHRDQIPIIAPTKSRTASRNRARADSATSISSESSADIRPTTRSTRGAWVRSRSKDGKRSHSPIFIRPGTSRSKAETKSSSKEPIASAPASHSRNNSASSSSSRSSSIFSHSGSRNNSISSQDEVEESVPQKPQHGSARKGLFSSKIAFKTPTYREEDFEIIAPKQTGLQRRDDGEELIAPVRSGRGHSRR